MKIVDRAVRDVRIGMAMHKVCPIVLDAYRNPLWGNDTTAFCTACPDVDGVPERCPEITKRGADGRQVCALYSCSAVPTATPEGGCRFAREGACTCFQPKGERWHRAYQAWLERHEREQARD